MCKNCVLTDSINNHQVFVIRSEMITRFCWVIQRENHDNAASFSFHPEGVLSAVLPAECYPCQGTDPKLTDAKAGHQYDGWPSAPFLYNFTWCLKIYSQLNSSLNSNWKILYNLDFPKFDWLKKKKKHLKKEKFFCVKNNLFKIYNNNFGGREEHIGGWSSTLYSKRQTLATLLKSWNIKKKLQRQEKRIK